MIISGTLVLPASTGGQIGLLLGDGAAPEGNRQVPVRVHDLSPSGLLIESGHPLQLGDIIATAFSEITVALGTIGWTGAKLFGCQFDEAFAARLFTDVAARLSGRAETEAGFADPIETSGARLQQLRKAKKLTQIEIAERLGVTTVAISNWESDRSQPRRHRREELAQILGVSRQQLETSADELPLPLSEMLASSKLQIATQLGIDPANVRISVDL